MPAEAAVIDSSRARVTERLRALFRGVTAAHLGALADGAGHRLLTRAQVLYRRGDRSEQLFVVERGAIKLSRLALDGRSIAYRLLGPDDVFGLTSVFVDHHHSCDAVAVTDSVVVSVPHAIVSDMAARSPPVATALARLLADEVRLARDALEIGLLCDVPQRMTACLCDLSDRFGLEVAEGRLIDLPLVQQDIAELVGTARETVSKTLSAFRAAGWIRSIDGRVVIVNRGALRMRAGLDDVHANMARGSAAW